MKLSYENFIRETSYDIYRKFRSDILKLHYLEMRRTDVQYGLGVNKYEEINEVENIKRKMWMQTSIAKLGVILIVGILLGRVNLLLNQSDSSGIAPIGIAYLIAIITKENKRNSLVAAIGIGIGYLTINNLLTDGYVYLIISHFNNNILQFYST